MADHFGQLEVRLGAWVGAGPAANTDSIHRRWGGELGKHSVTELAPKPYTLEKCIRNAHGREFESFDQRDLERMNFEAHWGHSYTDY